MGKREEPKDLQNESDVIFPIAYSFCTLKDNNIHCKNKRDNPTNLEKILEIEVYPVI